MRTICIVTSTRADYGLLYPLIKKIDNDKSLKLQLIVSGSHLSSDFGHTYKEISKEFKIDKKVNINLSTEKTSIAKSMGIACIKFSKVLNKLKPDILVLLGDRYEIFAVASVATTLNIPIAHIHGGELTFGAIDDAFRHSITKMSHIHFVSTKRYKQRVIQLGEKKRNIFNVGALGVENIKTLKLLSKHSIEKTLDFKFYKKNILITYHPETTLQISPKDQIKILLDALSQIKNTLLIFTKANADFGGIQINKEIDEFVKNNKFAIVFTSMGQLNYFSTLQYIDCVVGNSSSGILEVPSFNIPTINIGDRQKGRIQAKSILNIKLNKKEIRKSIKESYLLNDKIKYKDISNPYEKNHTSNKIIKVLTDISLDRIIKKSFFDIKVCR